MERRSRSGERRLASRSRSRRRGRSRSPRRQSQRDRRSPPRRDPDRARRDPAARARRDPADRARRKKKKRKEGKEKSGRDEEDAGYEERVAAAQEMIDADEMSDGDVEAWAEKRRRQRAALRDHLRAGSTPLPSPVGETPFIDVGDGPVKRTAPAPSLLGQPDVLDRLERVEPAENSEDEPDMFEPKTADDRQKIFRFVQASKRAADGDGDAPELYGFNPDLRADWDDKEGYYRARIGDIISERYEVTADACGRGMFSNVLKCTDAKRGMDVAIKVIRTNDMMKDAAAKEVEILGRLRTEQDKQERRHIVRLFRQFMFRNHLCLVFECMHTNLRILLKQYGRGKGLSLQAVRGYTKQLFFGLKLMRECQIIHADIKLDNILVSEDKQKLKICDLGCAHDVQDVELTTYVCSRFYRAAELCLGFKYDTQVDVWSTACSVYEIYSAEVLFPGNSNNDMLRVFQEALGKVPKKVIHLSRDGKRHFNDAGEFVWRKWDKVVRRETTKVLLDFPTLPLPDRVQGRQKPDASAQAKRKAKQLGELLLKLLRFDPSKRYTPEQGLEDPFITERWVDEVAKDKK